MNDQIKDFVEKNREEFDHLEAPAFDMQRFKRINASKVAPKVKTVPLFNRTKWLVAASVLIAMATTWLFFYQQQETKVNYSVTKPAPIENNLPVKETPKTLRPKAQAENKHLEVSFAVTQRESSQKKNIAQAQGLKVDYSALKDSSSASRRLLAILEIEKSGKVNNQVLNMLSQTLNHDGNTNVRLAALSVMQQYSADQYTSLLLVNSLTKQSDPIVQLGLISTLGKMKNVKIDDKLQAIANNPETFAAVREEAYNVLLNQDKL